jgi:hypothetical protein
VDGQAQQVVGELPVVGSQEAAEVPLAGQEADTFLRRYVDIQLAEESAEVEVVDAALAMFYPAELARRPAQRPGHLLGSCLGPDPCLPKLLAQLPGAHGGQPQRRRSQSHSGRS